MNQSSAGELDAFTGTCCLRITERLYHIISCLSIAFLKKFLVFGIINIYFKSIITVIFYNALCGIHKTLSQPFRFDNAYIGIERYDHGQKELNAVEGA